MNKFQLPTLLLLALLPYLALTQDFNSYLVNYQQPQEGIINKYEKTAQADNGVLFFSSKDKVHYYNGVAWGQVDVPGTVAYMANHSGNLWIACGESVGSIQKDVFGKYYFEPLHEIRDGSFSELVFVDGQLVAQADDMLYFFDVQESMLIDSLEMPGIQKVFGSQKSLFVHRNGGGVHEFQLKDKELLPNALFDLGSSILFYKSYSNDSLLLGTVGNEVFVFDGKLLHPIPGSFNSYIKGSGLTDGEILENDHIALATKSGGVIIHDMQGKLPGRYVNFQTGLPDDEVNALFYQNNGGLWICHGLGVTRADLCLPIADFSQFPGLEGELTTVSKLGNRLFIGTNEGLFYLAEVHDFNEISHYIKKEHKRTTSFQSYRTIKEVEKTIRITLNDADSIPDVRTIPISLKIPVDSIVSTVKDQFHDKLVRRSYALNSIPYAYKRIKGINSRIILLHHMGNTLLVGTNNGLYSIQNLHAKKLIENEAMISSAATENGVLIASSRFIYWLPDNDSLLIPLKIVESESDILDVIYERGECWFSTTKAINRFELDNGSPKGHKYYPMVERAPKFVSYKGQKAWLLDDGLYRFKSAGDSLTKELLNVPGLEGALSILKGHEGQSWIHAKDENSFMPFGHYVPSATPFLGLFSHIKDIYTDQDSLTWVLSSNAIYRIAQKSDYDRDGAYAICISSIENQDGDKLPMGPLKLKHNESTLRLNLASKFYLNEESIQYSYIVHGLHKDWSAWDQKPEAYFSYLPPGKYLIGVRAKNIFGKIAEIAPLRVQVKPPFWKSAWFYVLLIALLILLFYAAINFRTKKLEKANLKLKAKVAEATEEIMGQKEKLQDAYSVIEKKNRSITDSINYAQKIQEAFLPMQRSFNKILQDPLLLYLPRDIVSGDFYWIHEEEEYFTVVAADCTGHGVPGAFMSMIGITLLNHIVKIDGINDPSRILTRLDQDIIKSLRQCDSDNSDGMDASVCTYWKKKKLLQFSGAMNPILLFRNGELEQLRGDYYPIGGYYEDVEKEFKTFDIEIKEDTTCYIFSDGYADQFNPDCRKFMVKRFKNLLKEIHQKDFRKQHEILSEKLEEWKDGAAQNDDILVIGFNLISQ